MKRVTFLLTLCTVAGFALLASIPARAADKKKSIEGNVLPTNAGVQHFVFLSEARPVIIRVDVRVDGKPLQTVWGEFVTHLFAHLDVNNDGHLDKTEAERVPSASQMLSFGFGRGASGPKLDVLDKDKDGKVSRDELAGFYYQIGLTPFQLQLKTQSSPFGQAAIFSGQRPDPPVAAVGRESFKLLDVNKDGKLSLQEMAAAPARALKLDENEDELVTAREVAPKDVPKLNPFGGSMMAGSDGDDSKSVNGRVFLLKAPGQASQELAERMQEIYSEKLKRQRLKLDSGAKKPGKLLPPEKPMNDAPDKPKDLPKPPKTEKNPPTKSAPTKEGADEPAEIKTKPPGKKTDSKKPPKASFDELKKRARNLIGLDNEKKNKQPLPKLTRKEIELNPAEFAGLDKDKDGLLDTAELAEFAKRPADLEVIVHLADSESGETRVELTNAKNRPMIGTVETNDGATLLDLGATRLDLRGVAEQGMSPFEGLIRQQINVQLKRADKNNDGVITPDEAKEDSQWKRDKLFERVDRDGDKKVTTAELDAYLERSLELQTRARSACVTLVLEDESRGVFTLFDTNADAKLSIRELRQGPKLLKQFDRGGKGHLVSSDVPRKYQFKVRRGPANEDANNPSNILRLYYGSGNYDAEAYAKPGPRWFRKMDRNRDGDLSRKEFLFSKEDFARIDADNDGLISLAEAKKAGK